MLHRDGAAASLEEIARRAGVGSATLHRHFRGHRALLEAVFDDCVDQMCAEADRLAREAPTPDALWTWLRHVAEHCVIEKGLAALLRDVYRDAAQNDSFDRLGRAGQELLDHATKAGSVRTGVTIQELLLQVNAVADVCSVNGADVTRILEVAFERRANYAAAIARSRCRRLLVTSATCFSPLGRRLSAPLLSDKGCAPYCCR